MLVSMLWLDVAYGFIMFRNTSAAKPLNVVAYRLGMGTVGKHG